MERTKRMLIVMLTSFGIFALLTFLTFSSYGQVTSDTDYAVRSQDAKSKLDEKVKNTLVGAWKAEYNGETNYFTFNQDNSLIIRSDVFSNSIANPNDEQVGRMAYKINTLVSPYQLNFINGNTTIEGVVKIINNDKIIICHNFEDNNYQPKEISDDYTVLTLYRVKEGE